MRALLGISVLLLFCGAAALWQTRTFRELRRERTAAAARAAGRPLPADATAVPGGAGDLEPGWGVVVVGRPSGAPAVAAPATLDEPTSGRETPAAALDVGAVQAEIDWIKARSGTLGDFVLQVRSGQTLSQIFQDHYGSYEPALVKALARYNGLSDEHKLRVGSELHLPDLGRLEALR